MACGPDGVVEVELDWWRLWKETAMLSRLGIIAGVVLLGASTGWQAALADTVAVPGAWYDQDKVHWAGEEFSGLSWTHNYFRDARHPGGPWYQDYNGAFDPGEQCAEWLEEDINHNFRQDGKEIWPQYWYPADDRSCWMASGANLANYMGGGDWYQSWAYNPGLNTGTKIKTFVNSGSAGEALGTLGYSVLELEAAAWQWPENPVEWIKDKLAAGTPVSIGIHPANSPRHALTVYAIDDATHQLTIADSDQDWSSRAGLPDFRKFTYDWNAHDMSFKLLNYGGKTVDIEVAQCIDPTGGESYWVGKGTGPGTTVNWSHPQNWSRRHAPLPNDKVRLTKGTPEVEIDLKAKCYDLRATSGSTITLSAAGSLDSTSSIRLGTSQGAPGLATFNQTGGWARVGWSMYLGHSGANSKGIYHQTGGTHEIKRNLIVGHADESEGVYLLDGGELWVGNCTQVGHLLADGKFTQSGGVHSINTALKVGCAPVADKVPTYTISGGTLSADTINVGPDGDVGKLDISGADAEVAVFDKLRFGEYAKFAAVEGSTIALVGADFMNHCTAEAELSGLANVELAFDECDRVATLEAAGSDKGPGNAGFDNNFELGALTLGLFELGEDPGLVQLVDAIDNGNRGATGEAEALYVTLLAIGEDSNLLLNHLNLYAQVVDLDVEAVNLARGSALDLFGGVFSVAGNLESEIWGWINAGILVDSWISDPEFVAEYDAHVDWTSVYAIPEPVSLVLLGVGSFLVLCRRAG
jgi:hypothetical protein